jgi:Asp-tRNA(Asn)/Glu-tRNA(Gln) amidotransferase A subunit family amidase
LIEMDLSSFFLFSAAVSLLLLVLLSLWILWKYFLHSKLIKSVHQIISQRNESLTEIENKLSLPETKDREKILAMNLIDLKEAMDRQEFTSYQLVSLYISRCLHVGQQLNAITQNCYLEALNAAIESDQRRVSGKPSRLMEGIPFSVKDCYDQIGTDNTCGLATRVGKVLQHDCPLIHLLKQAGGIPFVRSNVPPILMAWETANSSYGPSLNPWNTMKVTGGSSGGEAALISSRCSPIGLGTDIGGSLRIPAACCGIYSLKPTTRRLSTKQLSCQEVPGQISILSSPGPMGRCVSDLDLLMRIWLQSRTSVSAQDEENTPSGTEPINTRTPSVLNHRGLSNLWYLDPYTPPTIWRNPPPGVMLS